MGSIINANFIGNQGRKKEEGRRKKEEGRRKREEGRRKKEEGLINH
ncbi:MAG: hypothetical protein ACRCT1_05185 [Microcoleaceae cyanobacterium]